jgi:hypothetical protein
VKEKKAEKIYPKTEQERKPSEDAATTKSEEQKNRKEISGEKAPLAETSTRTVQVLQPTPTTSKRRKKS